MRRCTIRCNQIHQGLFSAQRKRLHALPQHVFVGAHLVCEGLGQHVLVEGAREVGVDEMPVMQRLAHAAAHKLEEVEVVGATGLVVLDHAVGVGLEGRPAHGHGHKQREVGVEDLPRHHLRRRLSDANRAHWVMTL